MENSGMKKKKLNHPNCSVPKFEKPITVPNAHVNHVMPILVVLVHMTSYT